MIKIIDINDPNALTQIVDAIGIKPGDSVSILTPQFGRIDCIKVGTPPNTMAFFESLRTFSEDQLKNCGLQLWDKVDDGDLWLLPYEWYDFIPEGFELTCINKKVYKFSKDTVDNEQRFGALAYGIIRKG